MTVLAMALVEPPVEIDTLTARTKATWMAGDFGKIAKSYEPGAVEFIERLHLRPKPTNHASGPVSTSATRWSPARRLG